MYNAKVWWSEAKKTLAIMPSHSGETSAAGWKRASELSDNPLLFANKATRFDINQVPMAESHS